MAQATVEQSFTQLVGAFAGHDPLPAGGAAGVTAIAMGLGLGLKVIEISKPDGSADQVRRRLEGLLQRVRPRFAEDCAAFRVLLDALRLPRGDGAREVRVRDAWRGATTAPVAVAVDALEAESVLMECAALAKPSVKADLEAALELVACGRRIAERNARENAARLDASAAEELLAPLDAGQGL